MQFAQVIVAALLIAAAAEAAPQWDRKPVDVCRQDILNKLHSICFKAYPDVNVGTYVTQDIVNAYRTQLQQLVDYCCQTNCPAEVYVSHCF